MRRGNNPMLRTAALALALLLLVLTLGGPGEAHALAWLGEAGVGAAVGLAWIVLFPAVVLMVPPLLVAGLAEALQTRGAPAVSPGDAAGLGSRSVPGDTRRGDRGCADADRTL